MGSKVASWRGPATSAVPFARTDRVFSLVRTHTRNRQPLAGPKVNETRSSFALGRCCTIYQLERITRMLEDTEFESIAPGPSGAAEPAASQGDSSGSSASIDDELDLGQVTSALPGAPEVAPSSDGANAVWKIWEGIRRKDGSLGSSSLEFSAPIEATKIFQQMIDRGDYNRDPWERSISDWHDRLRSDQRSVCQYQAGHPIANPPL